MKASRKWRGLDGSEGGSGSLEGLRMVGTRLIFSFIHRLSLFSDFRVVINISCLVLEVLFRFFFLKIFKFKL